MTVVPTPPLLVISDRRQAKRPIEAVMLAAFEGGCRWVSLREKDLMPAERQALLGRLVSLGRPYGAVVGVHDDVEAALATGAGALHLPSSGYPAVARRRLPGVLIGASAHSAAEAAALFATGADYVTLSPIFATASKPGYGPALGLDGLTRAAAGSAGPIVALGGIDATNAALCLKAGAQGVAVMGEVMRAADPRACIENLIRTLPEARPLQPR